MPQWPLRMGLNLLGQFDSVMAVHLWPVIPAYHWMSCPSITAKLSSLLVYTSSACLFALQLVKPCLGFARGPNMLRSYGP